MPDADDVDKVSVYDRDEIVQAVTSSYQFLSTLHIPSSAIRYPPLDGWPDVDGRTYGWLNKNDRVIDLMRHLPYLSRDHLGSYQIYMNTGAIDYNGEHVQRSMRFAAEHDVEVDLLDIEPPLDYTYIPPHVLSLASETSGANGYFFLIDTDRGTITVYSLAGEGFLIEHGGTVKTDASKDILKNQEWRRFDTYRVTEFFEILKSCFRNLELVSDPNVKQSEPFCQVPLKM